MNSFKVFIFNLLLCLCFLGEARAQEVSELIPLISLRGYLGKEEMSKAAQVLASAPKEKGAQLIIEINSSSGDIDLVLEFAKALYVSQWEHHRDLTVYIQENAIGPAAIIPFFAESLYISPVVSWGDIPSGNEGRVPPNLLSNQVISFISPSHPHLRVFQAMAAAMSDKAAKFESPNGASKLEGETLVINQQQLKALDLVKGDLSLENFRKLMRISLEQSANLIVPPSISSGAALFGKNVLEQLKQHIRYSPEGPNVIGHLLIEDHNSSITQATFLYIKNALDAYKKSKPLFIILELNTPGGEVYPAQKISDALKEFDTQYDIPVVCFINNWAISAGAMLAYSCRFIVVAKDASMGAAEPIVMGEHSEMQPASEKVNSALRADFANRARFFDRNPVIAEAMVDKDLILVVRHGQVIKLDNDSQIRTGGPNPDLLLSPKGKLLTLDADQLLKYGVADILLLPQKTGVITESERESGKWPAEKMLLFHVPFFDQISNATIETYQMDWKERLFAFLASPLVSSLLLLGLVLGFYVEMSTPGFGLPGVLGLFCLILIILSSFALEIANWLEVILLFVGLAIIVVDLFLLPTFGLLGFVGLLFFLAGLFGLLLPGLDAINYEVDTNTFNAAGQMVLERFVWFSLTLLFAGGVVLLLARYLTPKLAAYSSLVLTGNEQDASRGYIANEDPKLLPQVGTKGEVVATLRPAGKIQIEDAIYEALSTGSFIEKGEKIVVVRLDGSSIIVDIDAN